MYRPSPLFASAFPILSVAEAAKEVASSAELKAQAVKSKALEAAGEKPTGANLYARFALAGAVGCAVTHGAATPMDVVKTTIQLEPKVYNKGMIHATRSIIAKNGAGALLTGLGPTIVGYSIQGAFKFGGYEFWKKQAIDYYGVEGARNNRQIIYLGSSAIAEFFADVALCPLEAVRIRLVSNPAFASGLAGGFGRILKEEGIGGFYAGFGPILFKQVPYTMAKFAVYEVAFEKICSAAGKKPSELTEGTKTAFNLTSGLIAGLAAAFISQPADTLLSLMNKTQGRPGQGMISRIAELSGQLGVKGLFGGMGARFVMIGSITAGQFGLYGSIKSALGATGGVEIAKA